jgi:hypothetical protein
MAIMVVITSVMFMPQANYRDGQNHPDAREDSSGAMGDVLGYNMRAHHQAAINYYYAHKTFRGVVPLANLSLGPFANSSESTKVTWTSLIDESTPGQVMLFTYTTSRLDGTNQQALLLGLSRANGFALGSGVVEGSGEQRSYKESGSLISRIRHSGHDDDSGQGGSSSGSSGGSTTVTVQVPANNSVKIPTSIPVGSVIQVTRL